MRNSFFSRLDGSSTCLVLAVIATGTGSEAMTRRVPGEFATINAAMDLSSISDTVLVAPGTYPDYETRSIDGFQFSACVFMRDGVALLSEDGPLVTSIDPGGVGPYPLYVVLGRDLNSGSTIIDGFTLTGSPPPSSAVLVATSERVTFRNCVVRDVDGQTYGPGGIDAYLADLEIVQCVFRNCRTSVSGGGGVAQLSAELNMADCDFEDCSNSAIGCFWGNTGFPPGHATIVNCTFKNCSAYYHGGAIYLDGITDPVITNCRFEGNRAGTGGDTGFGGAAAVGSFGAARIESCIFVDNAVVGLGGGGALDLHGAGIVKGNTFFRSSQIATTYAGSAAHFSPGGSTASLENNVIVESTGAEAVGVSSGMITSTCNVFWNNPDGEVRGHTLSPTDLIVDPLFCDPDAFDLTVDRASPCLPQNSGGCGLIGALGQGCGFVSVEETTWGRIKSMYR